MTTSSRSYNKLNLLGYNISDDEYVQEYGVPAEMAHTKGINDWMLDHVMKENIANGMPLEAARMARMKSEKEINELYDLHDL